ncbi:hypothetical protein GCM10025881_27370 [Pseudolysinimonas kribbensis]|uniref:Uncharacterized protein n=1 Tax=Pseudolysinimonas kribbensis TaxID=433641 RepID=A0ABQ6K8P7_9MICO|nr:hypothetical protein GCM10025881_27370 [Pseudolysinimonas kribbensis]
MRRLEMRRGRCGGELRSEFTESQVLAAVLDEREGRGVPERGRAAVAQHDLVSVREGVELGEAGAHPADEILDGGLAMRGAEKARVRLQVGELLRPDLGGAASESAVGGEEVCGDLERHVSSLEGD